MRLAAILLILIIILAGIFGPQAFYVVDETNQAVVTRFGDPRRSITSPGVYFKTPFVESVTYFEKRLLIFDAPPDDLLTKDKKRLVIDIYARGRIVNPLLFFRTLRTETRANSRVIDIIGSELRREIGLDDQAEIISTSREAIMNRVRDAVQPKVKDFGIEIIDVRLKRADFPPQIAESIYARMDAERKRIANAERAEGAERDLEIRAGVDRQATIILAEAERDANLIRGDGEAEAIRIFAGALEQDPEFYAFQRSLQAYKLFLPENTTVVLPADNELFQFLQSPSGLGSFGGDGAEPEEALGETGLVETEPVGGLAADAARALLSSELGIDPAESSLVAVESLNWPDASLGCPQEGALYAQVIVPGYRLLLEHNGSRFEFHTNLDGTQAVLCETES